MELPSTSEKAQEGPPTPILEPSGQISGHDTGETTAPRSEALDIRALPRALAPLLRMHKQAVIRRAAQGTQKGYWQEHTLVFPGRGGKPMNPIALRHQLKRLTDAARLPPVTTHMLRHTAGKFYADLGCPQEVIGTILGHGPRTITGHYAPVGVETLRPWVERVYGLLAGEAEQERLKKEA